MKTLCFWKSRAAGGEAAGGKAPRGKIVSFETVTLNTAGMRRVSDREIVMKDGQAEVSEYGLRYSDGEEQRVLLRRALCSEAQALKALNDCRLLSWDGFHGSHPKGVLDGTTFRLDATVNGGQTIHASGSQNFPRHYRELDGWLYEILRNAEEVGENE